MLPLRCATYLMYLAQADLYSNKIHDCLVKLRGMTDILGFKKSAKKPVSMSNTKYDTELENIIRDMQEIDLDASGDKYRPELSPSSQMFTHETFDLPTFVQHEQNCDCFQCNCVEYQDLVLKKIYLEAMLNFKDNNSVATKELLNTGLNLYYLYSQKFQTNINLNRPIIPRDLIPEMYTKYIQSYGPILLALCKLLMIRKKKASAEIINQKLVQLVEPYKHQFMYLYHESLLQKLALLTHVPPPEIIIQAPIYSPEQVMTKTPENHRNKVTVSTQTASPCSPINKIKIKKRLEFEISPESTTDINIIENKKMEPENMKPSTSKKLASTCNNLPPNSKKERLKKTAAPKIKIYTEDAEKRVVGSERVTRTKSVSEKISKFLRKSGISSPSMLQPKSEASNSRKKLSSRKNLHRELNLQTENENK